MKILGMRISPFALLIGFALVANLAAAPQILTKLPVYLYVLLAVLLGAACAVSLLLKRGYLAGTGEFVRFAQSCLNKDLLMLIGVIAFLAVLIKDMFSFSNGFYFWAMGLGCGIIGLCFWVRWSTQREEQQFHAQFSDWRRNMEEFLRAEQMRMGRGPGSAKGNAWSSAGSYSSASGYQPKSSDDPFAKDLYGTLGVEPTASDADIKKAYRKLAMKWHPDHNMGNKEAEKRFKEINVANEILSDADGRAFFDRIHGHRK